MAQVAFVFSGQGAQKPGMGRELYENNEAARQAFDTLEAKRAGTLKMCFEGPAQELNLTENTQPCLYAMETACAAAAKAAGLVPDAVAGFSLGELAALAFCGAVDEETGFEIVTKRAELMARDASAHPGAMLAVLKLEAGDVEKAAASVEGAWPVNYNCPGQTVVACLKETLPALSAAVKAAGGRGVPLKVSGGFHSPLMARASEAFGAYLGGVQFARPQLPLYANLTGEVYGEDIPALLAGQVCSPVRWQAIVEKMIARGVDTFVEIGPGKTLCGLIAKTNAAACTFHVEDLASLEEAVKGIETC